MTALLAHLSEGRSETFDHAMLSAVVCIEDQSLSIVVPQLLGFCPPFFRFPWRACVIASDSHKIIIERYLTTVLSAG